jgi:hypothetical protein
MAEHVEVMELLEMDMENIDTIKDFAFSSSILSVVRFEKKIEKREIMTKKNHNKNENKYDNIKNGN